MSIEIRPKKNNSGVDCSINFDLENIMKQIEYLEKRYTDNEISVEQYTGFVFKLVSDIIDKFYTDGETSFKLILSNLIPKTEKLKKTYLNVINKLFPEDYQEIPLKPSIYS